jgi:hypothetical protein
LRAHLEETYPEASVQPKDDRTFVSWDAVEDYLADTIGSVGDTVVVFLDIGLTPTVRSSQVREGMMRAYALKRRFSDARFVACTQFDAAVRSNEYYSKTFSSILNKQLWDSSDDFAERKDHLRRVVDEALPPQENASSALFASASIEDSLALRLFEAAFGEQTLRFLLADVATNWSRIEIRALSHGYSGAYLLQIAGSDATQAPRAIVVKAAKDKEILLSEAESVKTYFGALGALTPHVLSPEQQIHNLTNGYYIRQPVIPGTDLLRLIYTSTAVSEALVAVSAKRVASVLARCCFDGARADSEAPLLAKFHLTHLDQSRFRASLEQLRLVGATLKLRKMWPQYFPDVEGIGDLMRRIVDDWNRHEHLRRRVPFMVQHGDCNPGNILIDGDDFMLIDVARLARWPVGYDLSRLAIQLRSFLPDHEGGSDFFADGLPEWLSQTVAAVGQARRLEAAGGVCPLADACDEAFEIAANEYGMRSDDVRYAYSVGTLWDLIKIVSYGNLSVFKRTWALLECWRLVKRLRMIG